MKATGIIRPMDELGRIVLPMELRKVMDIKKKDLLEIFVEDSKIILQKYQPTCIFCKGSSNIVEFKGKNVCLNCMKELVVEEEKIEDKSRHTEQRTNS